MKRLDFLKARFAAALEGARRDPIKFGLPNWVDDAYLARARQIPVIVCGVGIWARAFIDTVRSYADIIAVVDDVLAGQTALGCRCIGTDEMIAIAEQRPEIVFINGTQSHAGYGHFATLAEELDLKMLNFLQAVRAWRLDIDVRVSDWLPAIVARAEEFTAVEPLLYDESSAEALYSILLYHLDTDREWLVTTNRAGDSSYFRTGLFALSDEEVYVDGGSYDGDSVRNFIHATRSRFKHVHAFEADPGNFALMQKWLDAQSRFSFSQRITLHQAAVGETNGTIIFNETGGEGACVPLFEGDVRLVGVKEGIAVPCVRLDDAISDRMTLLKLDIEGHELATLRGSVGHLTADRPRVATCAYHLPGDLIDLPQFFAGLDVGYRLAIRHHSNTRYDTVVYAF